MITNYMEKMLPRSVGAQKLESSKQTTLSDSHLALTIVAVQAVVVVVVVAGSVKQDLL